jgi:hypothetical protein
MENNREWSESNGKSNRNVEKGEESINIKLNNSISRTCSNGSGVGYITGSEEQKEGVRK